MPISRQQLKEYTEALEELVQLAQLDVRTTFDIYEPLGFAEALEEVIIAAQASSDYYGDMAATLAAELYEQLAYDEAGLTLDAMLADDCNHAALENNIEYAAHNHLFDGSADTDGFLNFVDGVMDKAVKQPARETIIENAARDEKTGVRYARVPSGDACSFCIMLGSRGWVYHSEQTAGSLGQYHRNCACAIVPSWEKSPRVEGYDPDALYEQWKNGTTSDDTEEQDASSKAMTMDEALKVTNPNFKTGEGVWTHNCQRCIYAYEMNRRGQLCEAKPRILDGEDYFAGHYSECFDGVEVESVGSTSRSKVLQNIRDKAANYGDGARGYIRIQWNKRSGHVFNFEQIDGETVFIDAQSGEKIDINIYLGAAMPTKTKIARLDNLEPTDLINEAVEWK